MSKFENNYNDRELPQLEKISLNVAVSELGRIDAVIEAGIATNRTEFIRTAIRKELTRYESDIEAIAPRKSFAMGVIYFSKKDVDKLLQKGETVDIRVVGYLRVAKNVNPEDLNMVVNSCRVYGTISAPKKLKEILKKKRPIFSPLGYKKYKENKENKENKE
ncbi:MAG: hypothetical protein ACXAC8_16295 [Candidatus Hodarchaeales archaeon]|jgi:Arc/MetJ-type ribon-helix-helix transcriptional regulator